MRALVSLITLIATCSNPVTPECQPQQTRCVGRVAEICSPEGHWATINVCADVQPGRWTCAMLDNLAVCTQETNDAAP